jgi:DUF2934 family protein
MTQPTEKEIKTRAYEIWERNGKPEGKEDEFWQQAEQELRNEDKFSPLRTPDNPVKQTSAYRMSHSAAAETILLYFVLPLWLLAGFADYLCHRASQIELTERL